MLAIIITRGVESESLGVRVFGLESESEVESPFWRRFRLQALSVLSGLMC